MTASKTTLPVLGVPVQSKTLNGMDSLLSIVQMPAGMPVATFAIGRGRREQRRAVRAARSSPTSIRRIGTALDKFRAQQTATRSCRTPTRRDDAPGRMTVGIVGAGQLGRMLALAGYPLGLDFLFLDPAEGAPAGQVAPQIVGAFTDAKLLGAARARHARCSRSTGRTSRSMRLRELPGRHAHLPAASTRSPPRRIA